MTVFIAAFFVSSNGCLPTALNKGVDTDASSVQIHVGNSNELSPDGITMLDVQVTLEAANFEEAESSADRVLRVYLDSLTLLTTFRFKIEGLRAVLDATPGLVDRRCIAYRHFPAAEDPLDGLDTEVLVGARLVHEVTQPSIVRRAMRWFAIAVKSEHSDEQFQFFWLALELIAEHEKPSEKVPDLCPHCRGSLFCVACSKTPTHKPYLKQAIRDLFVKIAKSNGEKLFEVCDEIRNVLMHGHDLDGLLASKKLNLSRIVDSLGTVARVAVFNSIKTGLQGHASTLPFLETNTYASGVLTSKLDLLVRSSDPTRARIDDIPNLQTSVRTEAEGSAGRTIHGLPFANPSLSRPSPKQP